MKSGIIRGDIGNSINRRAITTTITRKTGSSLIRTVGRVKSKKAKGEA